MNLRDWYYLKGMIEMYLMLILVFICIFSYSLGLYVLYFVSLIGFSYLLGRKYGEYSNKAYKLESWERQC